MKQIMLLTALSGSLALNAQAQDIQMPKPSPTTTVKQDFSTSSIALVYSRPSVKGREIFGDLVPFDKVWRTGANEATKITFGETVQLMGNSIKAGSYALYTIPGEKEWTIILNTGLSNWGTMGFDEKDDVAQFRVPAKNIAEKVETFTISIDNMTKNTCDLVLSWDHTRVIIPIRADNDQRIMDYLKEQLAGPKPPYQQAASYYLEMNRNLEEAADYADKAIAANPKAFYLHWLKARILKQTGNTTEALAEAKKAAEGAAGSAFADEYQNHYETLKKEMK
jgi:hypothetical protein